jgi:two-component system NtrC family response regulator
MDKMCVLLVDDDDKTLSVLSSKLDKWGFDSVCAQSGKEALDALDRRRFDLVISDLRMPKIDGLELLREVKKAHDNVPFIMVTGYGTIDTAVASLKEGAVDFLQKPYDPESLLAVIKRTLAFFKLSKENVRLKKQLKEKWGWENIITCSRGMLDAIEMAKKVSKSPSTIIAIYGESGTGKDLLAKSIHYESDSSGGNFVQINCAGIPANLLESELFGYVKGAFTGADSDRDGKFDLAQGGTVFLDEIGDMSLDLQAKLLTVLQERTYEKVGSGKKIAANFRVIVATHRDLQGLVGREQFRQDLFHRINTFPIYLPPLRERREDIPLLIKHYLHFFSKEFGRFIAGISAEAFKELENYSWPGNVRELRNCIERAIILSPGRKIEAGDLNIVRGAVAPANIKSETGAFINSEDETLTVNFSVPLGQCSLETITNEVLRAALKQCDNNKSRAAQLLKVDRRLFYRCTE